MKRKELKRLVDVLEEAGGTIKKIKSYLYYKFEQPEGCGKYIGKIYLRIMLLDGEKADAGKVRSVTETETKKTEVEF